MWSVLFPDSWSNCTPCMAAPTLPVLDYLIFSHLQTPKWKCRGIWATSFGRRARNVGTVHRLSHSGLLNTKSTVQRTPCLDGEGFGRTVAMCERIWTLRKIPCYSFFFFFKYPLLINSILFSQRTLSSHNTYVFNFIALLLIYCFVTVFKAFFWWTLCFCLPNYTLSFLPIKTMPCLHLGFLFFFFFFNSAMTALNL